MGRFRETSEEGGEPGVDMSPLMDCVFILLIFFIVTTTFVEESGHQVDKPQAGKSLMSGESTTISLMVHEDGVLTLDGQEIRIGTVRTEVKRRLQEDKEAPVIITTATNAKTGQLVRVIDEAKLGGAEKISISEKKGQ